MPAAPTTPDISPALEKTLRDLTKTSNAAAVEVLVPALDSPRLEVQLGALAALLDRRSAPAQRAILARLHEASRDWRSIIDAKKGRMTAALRDGLLGSDDRQWRNACQAILWFREYDLVGALLAALEAASGARLALAGETLLALAEMLYADVSASPRDSLDQRDPQLVRARAVNSLEASVRRYVQHQRRAVVSAFLLLAHRENVTLKQILQDPHHVAFVTMIDELAHGQRAGVIQLLLSFLDDPHAPSAAISVLARREDPRFVQALLHKCAHRLSPAATKNLAKIAAFGWLKSEPAAWAAFDETCQQGVVQLAVSSNIDRAKIFPMVEYLALQGTVGGRVAAIRALTHFSGATADALVRQSLDAAEPEVQAAALLQARTRGMSGAVNRLIAALDSPHECVRDAAREGLGELSFERFMAAFDTLDDDVRRSTGKLVRKIDPQSAAALTAELSCPSRKRRLRAFAIAETMELFGELEATLIQLLEDSDHLVRREASLALAGCPSMAAEEALREAMDDRNTSVQEAAQQSLARVEWQLSGGEPSNVEARP